MKGWGMITDIKSLLNRGLKVSAVARRLNIDRKTVRKYRDMDLDEVADYRKISRDRKKKTDHFRALIDDRLDKMAEDGIINAQAIHDEIVGLGYAGSSRTLRRYVHSRIDRYRKRNRIYEPFETKPGYQAMVDLGESRKVWISGKKSVIHFLVMTLCFSRKMYLEWFDRPIDTEMFIRFHQNAFSYFGGIPYEIVYDQTKLVSLEENFGEIEFNREFYGFAQWSDFKIYLCRKRDPETKGKVESSVKYVKRGFLPGRRFCDFRDLQSQWSLWLHQVADLKANETTGDAPSVRLEEERSHLKFRRDSVYPVRPAFRKQLVYDDGLVKVLGNRYSVPSQFHGKEIRVRVTDTCVEMRSLKDDPVFTHKRCFEKGKRIIIRAHYRKKSSASTKELEDRLLQISKNPDAIQILKKRFPRHYREQLHQIIRLGDKTDQRILRQAIETSINLRCVQYSSIKKIAVYLFDQAFEKGLEHLEIPESFHEIPDLQFEQRPLFYYDELLEVS